MNLIYKEKAAELNSEIMNGDAVRIGDKVMDAHGNVVTVQELVPIEVAQNGELHCVQPDEISAEWL